MSLFKISKKSKSLKNFNKILFPSLDDFKEFPFIGSKNKIFQKFALKTKSFVSFQMVTYILFLSFFGLIYPY